MHLVPLPNLLPHAQIGVMRRQQQERDQKYALARAAADKRGKQLLVVGGPYGWPPLRIFFNAPAHGPGDVCVDISPQACTGAAYTESDIRRLPFGKREFGSAYSAHVLEHMPTAEDCAQAYRELHRVADEVFICVPEKASFFAWWVPGHHLWVREKAPGVLEVEERVSRLWVREAVTIYGR